MKFRRPFVGAVLACLLMPAVARADDVWWGNGGSDPGQDQSFTVAMLLGGDSRYLLDLVCARGTLSVMLEDREGDPNWRHAKIPVRLTLGLKTVFNVQGEIVDGQMVITPIPVDALRHAVEAYELIVVQPLFPEQMETYAFFPRPGQSGIQAPVAVFDHCHIGK